MRAILLNAITLAFYCVFRRNKLAFFCTHLFLALYAVRAFICCMGTWNEHGDGEVNQDKCNETNHVFSLEYWKIKLRVITIDVMHSLRIYSGYTFSDEKETSKKGVCSEMFRSFVVVQEKRMTAKRGQVLKIVEIRGVFDLAHSVR